MTSGKDFERGCRRSDRLTLAAVSRGGLTVDETADDWLALRLVAKLAMSSRETAARVIGEAPPMEDPWVSNLVAGVAEHIAATMDVPIPDWCQDVEPLTESWEPDGTPMLLQRWRSNAIPELRRRGILIELASIWSDV